MAGRGKLGKSSTAGNHVASLIQHLWTRLVNSGKLFSIPSFSTSIAKLRQLVTY
ncbi:Hypothetical protein, conserved [Brucella abortus str. 2308 A]|nr:Hypothetical protein, conserved [Brucella abortus str. 2308 A]EFM57875.1 Hypothetical protein BIBO1_0137 [Brucella inopinata BO1]